MIEIKKTIQNAETSGIVSDGFIRSLFQSQSGFLAGISV